MIEFNGYLTGNAENYFHKRSRILGQKIVLYGLLLFAPGIVSFAFWLKDLSFIAVFLSMLVCVMLFTFIPKEKKEKHRLTPKKIIVEEDYVLCVSDKYTETRSINDVKKVIDHGEYYELCFSFGKLSDKFICQKNLITKGTIQEFETLFSGKITRDKA